MKNHRLTDLREQAGMTQGQLAQQVGVSQSMIARIESGHREPRRRTKILLAGFFSVSVEWLFYEQVNDLKSYPASTGTEGRQ